MQRQSDTFATESEMSLLRRLGTSSDNRHRPIHRWYPFIEGYSADMLLLGLDLASKERPTIHDPFGGSGTTCLAASQLGFDSSFCEINPFLAWVADLKATGYIRARGRAYELHRFGEILTQTPSLPGVSSSHPLLEINRVREYFSPIVASQIVSALVQIDTHLHGPIRELARLAVAMTLVPTSNMIRRTDLRRRRPEDPRPRSFPTTLAKNISIIAEDLEASDSDVYGKTTFLCEDARLVHHCHDDKNFDLIVTSPPYLNGTNYCRNTKLELITLGFIEAETELSSLRRNSITAGINNVSSRRGAPSTIDAVEDVAQRLNGVAYDSRIAKMVRLYFSDMQDAFISLRHKSSADATFILDIGDSKFAGVHVPTHELLCAIATECGWRHNDTVHIRNRRSYDGSKLVQVVLLLEAI